MWGEELPHTGAELSAVITVNLRFTGVIWRDGYKLHKWGWAVICVRSVLTGQMSLSTSGTCLAKQINFRFCVSDYCDSASAATMLISPWYPERYFMAEKQVKHKWDLQLLESVTQSPKDLGELFCPQVNRDPEPTYWKKIPKRNYFAHSRLKSRLRSHGELNTTLQEITDCLTNSVSLNYCRKYVASNTPFITRTWEIQS